MDEDEAWKEVAGEPVKERRNTNGKLYETDRRKEGQKG